MQQKTRSAENTQLLVVKLCNYSLFEEVITYYKNESMNLPVLLLGSHAVTLLLAEASTRPARTYSPPTFCKKEKTSVFAK